MGGKEKSGASASSLGRALVRQHNQKLQQSKDKGAILRNLNKKVLTSYTETTDIEAVIEQAEEAARIHSLSNPAPTLSIDIDEERLEDAGEVRKQEEALYATSLRVPRRPPWTSEMSVEELDANEKQAFLEWRRRLARVEENEKLFLTPFEKNLDIWRQLWRVLERSDLLVMVVDGRNPLFYRCPDLEAYAQEINEHKKTLLLVNKADLLPLSVRKKWAKYFQQHGILFLFWSAKAASDFLDNRKSGNQSHSSHESGLLDEVKIYNRIELLARLQMEAETIANRKDANEVDKRVGDYSSNDSAKGAQKPVVVGFVGYPNVGKSSTINALVGEKRTGVTSTPGKTKHFQTLIISEKLVLCDCPGLVFPSFSSSRYEMIASGVLPVDRMTSHREAVQVVASRVPRHLFNNVYNITLPKPKSYEVQSRPPLAAELLRTYCSSRGYVVASGLPDEMKAARLILKDYIDGKLPHFEIPPDMAADGDMEETVELDSMSCDSCVSDEVDPSMGNLDEDDNAGKPKLDHYVDELDSFDGISGLSSVCISKKEKKTKASSKYHKKPQRNKDRSWRVGNDGGDGMPVSRVLQKNPLPSSKYVT